MYMTLPQPFWSVTGSTPWIMSACHQTESPALTSGMPLTACRSNACQVSFAGKTLLVVTPHMSSSGTSASSGRSIR
jgi:hypothetical protein